MGLRRILLDSTVLPRPKTEPVSGPFEDCYEPIIPIKASVNSHCWLRDSSLDRIHTICFCFRYFTTRLAKTSDWCYSSWVGVTLSLRIFLEQLCVCDRVTFNTDNKCCKLFSFFFWFWRSSVTCFVSASCYQKMYLGVNKCRLEKIIQWSTS